MNIDITREKVISEEGLRLIALLTADLSQRYQDLDGSAYFTPEEMKQDGAVFVVAHLDGEAVACGAIRPLEEGVAELKRMYTVPHARGRGIARRVLHELESFAAESGYETIRLHTGTPQPEAIAMYESSGYARIPTYGVYAHDDRTVSFEKNLTPGT